MRLWVPVQVKGGILGKSLLNKICSESSSITGDQSCISIPILKNEQNLSPVHFLWGNFQNVLPWPNTPIAALKTGHSGDPN